MNGNAGPAGEYPLQQRPGRTTAAQPFGNSNGSGMVGTRIFDNAYALSL